MVAGTVGIVASVAIIGAVGLLPLPSHRIAVPTVTVTPDPADQVRVCPGALLRLGDESGQNANTPSSLGAPSVTRGGIGADLTQSADRAQRRRHRGRGRARRTCSPLAPAAGATLAGAQSQVADAPDYTGFAAAACAEPSGSIWLVGGSTAVGRTTLLTLANPSPVDATVALTILSASGPVNAPGMSGIVVKAGAQRVIPLAGFAPDVDSPVVHVVSRGGQVVAALQQSIVRGLDAGGVDLVGAAGDPATHLVIPGVRVFDAIGVSKAAGACRTGTTWWRPCASPSRARTTAKVQVDLVPQDASSTGSHSRWMSAPARSSELALDSGCRHRLGRRVHPGRHVHRRRSTPTSRWSPACACRRPRIPRRTGATATSDTDGPAVRLRLVRAVAGAERRHARWRSPGPAPMLSRREPRRRRASR